MENGCVGEDILISQSHLCETRGGADSIQMPTATGKVPSDISAYEQCV